MPVLPMPKNLGNYSRLAWATAWRLGGRVKERTGLLTKTTLEHKTRRFPLHHPSKIIGTLMQGKPWVDKVAVRGPHCAWLCHPCLKTWGNHCWLAWTGPWRSSGRCRGEGQVGLCVGKAKISTLIKLTATHPPPPRLHPLARSLGYVASTRHLQ